MTSENFDKVPNGSELIESLNAFMAEDIIITPSGKIYEVIDHSLSSTAQTLKQDEQTAADVSPSKKLFDQITSAGLAIGISIGLYASPAVRDNISKQIQKSYDQITAPGVELIKTMDYADDSLKNGFETVVDKLFKH